MSYKDNFKKRNKRLLAEEMCVQYMKDNNIKHTRYGFDCLFKVDWRDFNKIPAKLRNTPDYVIFGDSNAYLLEVKGCHDILRLKLDDLKSYRFWKTMMDLFVFIYSTKERKHKIITIKKLEEIAMECTMSYYEENNKAYYKIPWEKI